MLWSHTWQMPVSCHLIRWKAASAGAVAAKAVMATPAAAQRIVERMGNSSWLEKCAIELPRGPRGAVPGMAKCPEHGWVFRRGRKVQGANAEMESWDGSVPALAIAAKPSSPGFCCSCRD